MNFSSMPLQPTPRTARRENFGVNVYSSVVVNGPRVAEYRNPGLRDATPSGLRYPCHRA
jgi:hypothetical protein